MNGALLLGIRPQKQLVAMSFPLKTMIYLSQHHVAGD